jgi:hypothetical protein
MVVGVLLAGLAIKTWIGEQKRRGTVIGEEDGTRDGEPAGPPGEP